MSPPFDEYRMSNKELRRKKYFPFPSFLSTTSAQRPTPNALTLIEMLIGMAITLVMMAAVVTLFANIGQSVSTRRAGMEMNGQLRMVRSRLFKDLAGATCPAKPWREPGNDEGYIEIIEGRWSDKNPSGLIANGELDYAASLIPGSNLPLPAGNVTDGAGLGDYDDILALTVRSESEPFKGRRKILRVGGVATNPNDWIDETIESNLAEVVWYSIENPADGSLGEPGMRTVYRRVLLIAPWVVPINLAAIATTGGTFMAPGNANRFYQRFDISARFDIATGTWIPNTLSDLTKRENRFAHFFDSTAFDKGFPHAMVLGAITPPNATPPAFPTGSFSPLHPFGEPWFTPNNSFDDPEREGEDVMLNDVLAFDVRVFDPIAELIDFNNSDNVVGPSDAGWRHNYNVGLNPIVGIGAYVDLNYGEKYLDYANQVGINPAPVVNGLVQTHFVGPPTAKSQLSPSVFLGGVYDTWPTHYEDDGLDQDDTIANDDVDDGDSSTGEIDEGTNGLDDVDPIAGFGVNGTDDVGERETSPPYDVPLRGMQVKIRIYERDTRQIREATVTKNFSN